MDLQEHEIEDCWRSALNAAGEQALVGAEQARLRMNCAPILNAYHIVADQDQRSKSIGVETQERQDLVQEAHSLAKKIRELSRPERAWYGTATDSRNSSQRHDSKKDADELANADRSTAALIDDWAEREKFLIESAKRRGGAMLKTTKMAVGSPRHVLVAEAIPVFERISQRRAARGTGPFYEFCTQLLIIASGGEDQGVGLERQIREVLDYRDKRLDNNLAN